MFLPGFSSHGERKNVYVFRGANTTYSTQTLSTRDYLWQKPADCRMVSIFAVGGGGGGGSALNGYANGTYGFSGLGGAGGGSAAQAYGIWPAWVLPDTLIVTVGAGGKSNTSNGGGPGFSGGSSYVAGYGQTDYIIYAAGGSGGGRATSLINGSFASPGSPGTATDYLFSKLGLFFTANGISGGAGSSNTSPGPAGPNTFSTTTGYIFSSINTGGGGGGGQNISQTGTIGAAGGGASVGGQGIVASVSGGSNIGSDGANGVNYATAPTYHTQSVPFFLAQGGAGGGGRSSNVLSGGIGGNGAFPGAGGGGGGASRAAVAFGGADASGGIGGDGVVVITCW